MRRDLEPCAGSAGAPFASTGLRAQDRFPKEVTRMALLIILALLVALFIGLGFVVKWLFILAVIAALVWLITFFMGRARARV
jgi:hypothetical protein